MRRQPRLLGDEGGAAVRFRFAADHDGRAVLALRPPSDALLRAADPHVPGDEVEHLPVGRGEGRPAVHQLAHVERRDFAGAGLERAVGALAGEAAADVLLIGHRHALRPPVRAVDHAVQLRHHPARDLPVAQLSRADAVHEREPLLPCPLRGSLDWLDSGGSRHVATLLRRSDPQISQIEKKSAKSARCPQRQSADRFLPLKCLIVKIVPWMDLC